MRLLFLDTHPGIRGPLPKICPVMVRSLGDLGCDVVTRPWGQQAEGESLLTKLTRGLRDLASIGKALKADTFDVLFVNTAHDARSFARDIPLLLLTRLLGQQKAVILFHGSQSGGLLDRRRLVLHVLTRWILHLSNAVLLLSTEEERAWRQFYPHMQYSVVRLPRVAASEAPSLPPKALSVPRDLPCLLFVGRAIKEKGVLDLIEAMPRVLSRVNSHLLVVGDGADRASAQERVFELGLQSSVTFTGYLRGPDLWRVYEHATVFVLPSYFPEGFPVVIMEAMQAGLPIITTRIRGMADWLREPENTLFVPAQAPDTLAQCIIQLLSDRALRESMGTANRRLIKGFEPMVVAREWLSELEEIVRAKGNSAVYVPDSLGVNH
jgi:glycosyltransferase involved in cell wall biosynthesis